MGAPKQPTYRIVAADSHAPRDGRFLEILGNYNPRAEPVTLELNEERVRYWLSQGAQPTVAVVRLLKQKGIVS